MKRRICFVLPKHWSAVMGGTQYQAKVLIEHLTEQYDVDIHYVTTACDPEFRPEGYKIVRLPDLGSLRRYGRFFDAIALYRALVRLQPDIVFQAVGCAYTGVAALYARRRGARMVWRVASERDVRPRGRMRIHHWIERRLLDYGIRRADLILAQTETQKRELARHFGRSDAVVVSNFHPYPKRARAPKSRDVKQVVWIGNLKPVKDPAAFVRLALQFREREDVRFVMVGAAMMPGRWTDELMRLIESAPNLRYLGVRTQDEVNELLEWSHILVNTSEVEGFSNAFIQAWMRGVPVVSLRVDPDALLSERKLGLLSRSEAGLRRDVQRLLEDDEARERIGEVCRDYATSHHSIANIDELVRLLGIERITAEPFDTDVPRRVSAAALES